MGLPTDCALGCALALDADDIYFSQPNGIARVPKAGGPAAIFADDVVQASAIAIATTRVYWATPLRSQSNATIKAAAKATGKVEILVADAKLLDPEAPVVVDDRSVYFVSGGLRSVPLAGGEVKDVLSMTGYSRGVVISDGEIFWGAEVKHIGAPHTESPVPLVGDPTRRREVTVGGGRAQGEGGLWKHPKTGANVQLLEDKGDVDGLAVDATAIYWIDKSTQKVRKIPR